MQAHPSCSPPPPPRTKLPEILKPGGVRQSYSSPPDCSSEDPFNQKHSRLYERRKQIEAELRREFNLPEEDVDHIKDAVHKHVIAAELRSPLLFGRPPPVPKPRRNQRNLPPIPRLLSEPPRRRWGIHEDSSDEEPRNQPRSPQEQWWRQEQEELRRRSREQTPSEDEGWPPAAPPAPPPPVQLPSRVERNSNTRFVPRERPNSWRHGRGSVDSDASPASPAAAAGAAAEAAYGAMPDEFHRDGRSAHRDDDRSRASLRASSHSPSSRPQHVEKAKELEEIARQHREWHQEERRRAAALAEREAATAAKRRADEEEREQQRRAAEAKAQELKRAEERRFEELKREEAERRKRDLEEAERRRKEQEDWERDIRQKFKQEEEQRRRHYQQEMEHEAERHEKVKEKIYQDREQQKAKRQEEEEHLRRERRDREARKAEFEAEAERLRRRAADQAKADEVRKAAEAEAEKLRRRCQEANATPGPKRGRAASYRNQQANFNHFHSPGDGPSPAGPGAQRRAASVPAVPTSSPADEAVKQAEAAAMQQLKGVQRLPTKEERQRAFKELLRAWHPDKNPQSAEVATAVFQRLQAERKRVLS